MTIDIAHASASRVRAALDGRHDLTASQVNNVVDTLLAAGLCTADQRQPLTRRTSFAQQRARIGGKTHCGSP